jgi:hypothetical protein
MKMKRVEIIGNHSIQSDLFEALEIMELDNRYSLVSSIIGMGSNGGRLGTTVWPEENFLMILYLNKKQVDSLFPLVQRIKEKFPDEGIKMAVSDVEVLL